METFEPKHHSDNVIINNFVFASAFGVFLLYEILLVFFFLILLVLKSICNNLFWISYAKTFTGLPRLMTF